MYSGSEGPPGPFDTSASGATTSASLTYEPFFGLREKPFSLSADPRFLFRSPAHAPAFDSLLAGIRRREGLIVLTGEIGTGKTTLCRSVLQHLDRRTFAAFVADPFVSREDLLKSLLVDFGVISISDLRQGRFNGASRSDLSYPLYEFLDSLVPLQAFAVLVIDEAQNLSLPLLEEIRILSELERREKLLQVVLVGQPELRSSLRLPQMRQVDQRVSVRCELMPLDTDGVEGYVHHRLRVAGFGRGHVEFTPAAVDALYQGSAGVPRVINRLCDRALDRAYAARSLRIDAQFVLDAIQDLGQTTGLQDRQAFSPREVVVHAPPQPTPLEPVLSAGAPADVDLFPSENVAATVTAVAPPTPTGGPNRRRWPTAALASSVAIVATLGGPAWYLHAQMADVDIVTPQRPLPPLPSFVQPGLVLPEMKLDAETGLPRQDAAGGAGAAATTAGGAYTIAVASFTSRARAARLVEELLGAGYRAHAVERDWGPPRGRLFHVNVGNYSSTIDVQRDLQRIRELPGAYRDARIFVQ
jgi:type II secretory pathway predicted ATPase ExeA